MEKRFILQAKLKNAFMVFLKGCFNFLIPIQVARLADPTFVLKEREGGEGEAKPEPKIFERGFSCRSA